MTIAFRIDGKNWYSQTKISRSMFRSRTRDQDLRLRTAHLLTQNQIFSFEARP